MQAAEDCVVRYKLSLGMARFPQAAHTGAPGDSGLLTPTARADSNMLGKAIVYLWLSKAGQL
jgi:hypothetical protein